jgi:hypothetical protein
MSGLFAATEPARTIVIERGGTPWWVPLVIGLATVAAAALASYLATWWFKKRDIDGENARQAVALIGEAEKAVSGLGGYSLAVSSPLGPLSQLLQEARIRAQPLGDAELDDRLKAASSFVVTFQEWREKPDGSRRWLGEAIANVREGFAAYLAPSPLIPWRRTKIERLRSFPTYGELLSFERRAREPEALVEALEDWHAARADRLDHST